MDLISIAEILWRRKVVAIPLIALTLLGAFYVVKVRPPVYQAQSSLLMVPPTPPTSSQIAADPKLAKINPSNPYVAYGSYAVVADTLIDVVTDSANQQALAAQGADPHYTLALSSDYGNPPIIDITGVGRTAAIAIKSAQLVTEAAEANLVTIQENQGVNSLYMIKSTQLVTPTYASQALSGKLRTLIAVLAVGVLLLFVTISLVEAVEERRKEKASEASAKARTSQSGRQRVRFLSRHRTRPGWAPGNDAGYVGPGPRPRSNGGGSVRNNTHAGSAALGSAPVTTSRSDRQHPRQPPVPTSSARPSPLDRLPVRPAVPPGTSGTQSQ